MSRPGPWVWWSMQPFEDNEPERVPWWRRFVRMWNDLGFYRDIFTNVLATGLVAVLAYAYAIGAGYVKSPSGKQTLLGIWNVAVMVFVFILILVGQF
jgi:hypothetical protein